MTIRTETATDRAMVREVNEAAFGQPAEADLIDTLRAAGDLLLALVAEREGQVVGHVVFSRMWIDTPTGSIDAVALAPLAVLPASQRQGVGGRLIRRGVDMLRASGERIVIVLGHPDYYPRFGFSAERAQALESPFPRPAFMALELCEGALHAISGRVRYSQAFGL